MHRSKSYIPRRNTNIGVINHLGILNFIITGTIKPNLIPNSKIIYPSFHIIAFYAISYKGNVHHFPLRS